jgi:hypothetical protein
MKKSLSFETLVPIHQITRRHIPEHRNFNGFKYTKHSGRTQDMFIHTSKHESRSSGSSVGIVTGYGLNDRGQEFESW